MQSREACPGRGRGRISCQGPKGLMGKGPTLAKSMFSLHPQAKGSWTKAGSRTPTVCPHHTAPPRPLPGGLPSRAFSSHNLITPFPILLPAALCDPRAQGLAAGGGGGGVSPPLSSLQACLSSRTGEKNHQPQPCHGSTMRNRKPLCRVGQKVTHSLYCGAPQSRGHAGPQPQEPHGPGVSGCPPNRANELWGMQGYGSF